VFNRRRRAYHRLLGEPPDIKPSYTSRTKLLLALISLTMSFAMWYHVRTELSISPATHVHPIEEDFEDYGVCDMPGPCWSEDPPAECECY